MIIQPSLKASADIIGLSMNERDQLVTFNKLRDGEITQTAAAKMLRFSTRWVRKKFKVPALFIHGECDPLMPVQAGKATAQAVPQAQLVIIPGMGHMIFDKHLENDIAKRLIELFVYFKPSL